MDDQLFRAVIVPWMSADPVACVVSEGRGLTNLFDDERVVEPLGRTSVDMTGWQFVGLLRGEFAGMNTIAWLVFVQK